MTILKGLGVIVLFVMALFWELWFKGWVAVPADTLTGAYFPWLAYKWGYQVGVPVKNALTSDVFSQFFLWKHVGMDMFFSGQLPLWNPFVLSGTPFLATFHSSLLSPANIAFLLPKFWGWNVFIVGSVIWAGWWCFLYLLELKISRLAALIGSLTFALGGPMTTWSEFGTAVWAAGSIPAILWLVERQKFAFIPALVAFLVLAGNVQIVTYCTVIYLLYCGCKFLWTKKLAIVIGVYFLGFGLAGLQLLPTWNFYKQSIRSQEKYSSYFNYGLSPLGQLVRFIAPDFFGHPSTGNYFNNYSYHEYTGFFGTASLVLVVAYLLYRPSGWRPKFFTMLFIGSIVLAIDNPLNRFVFSLPIPLLTYSSASRLYFVSVLSAGVLVSLAVEKLRDKKFTKLNALSGLILLVVVLLGLLQVKSLVSLRNSLVPIAILMSLIFLPAKSRLVIILLVLALDLGRYFRKYNTLVPARLVFPQTKLLTFLQENSDYRYISLDSDVLPVNTGMYYHLRTAEGYDPLHLSSYNSFAQTFNGQSSLNTPSRYVDVVAPNLAALRQANVGYYLTKQTRAYPSGVEQLPIVFTGEGVVIHKDPKALPYSYFVEPLLYIAETFDSGFKARSGSKQLKVIPANGPFMAIDMAGERDIAQVKLYYYPDSVLYGTIVTVASLILAILVWKKSKHQL